MFSLRFNGLEQKVGIDEEAGILNVDKVNVKLMVQGRYQA